MRRSAQLVLIHGGAGSGKTSLALELMRSLQARGRLACLVNDVLAPALASGKPPQCPQDWHALWALQSERVRVACLAHELVVVDGSPQCLSARAAVHGAGFEQAPSAQAEGRARPRALQAQSRVLHLLMSMDLCWPAQHASCLPFAHNEAPGEALNEALDTRLRASLQAEGLGYTVVAGRGSARTLQAVSALEHWLQNPAGFAGRSVTGWRWMCEDCGDGDCEQHWLTRTMSRSGAG